MQDLSRLGGDGRLTLHLEQAAVTPQQRGDAVWTRPRTDGSEKRLRHRTAIDGADVRVDE
jgi:hypothetical protein